MADYISNKDFSKALVDYREACFEHDKMGIERPAIPRAIAEAFMLLANGLSLRHNFVRYSYREDMVSEALIVCCRKVTNFDPAVAPNAFGYFNRICWRAFIAYMAEEKKEAYVKAKTYYNMIDEHGNPFEGLEEDEHELTLDFIPYFDVEEFEKKDADRRTKLRDKAKNIPGALDEDDEDAPNE